MLTNADGVIGGIGQMVGPLLKGAITGVEKDRCVSAPMSVTTASDLSERVLQSFHSRHQARVRHR